MGANPAAVLSETQQLIDKLPKVSGSGAGQVYPSQNFSKLLDQAFKEASAMQDEYVSQEHLFLAVLKSGHLAAAKTPGSGLASPPPVFFRH